ncbi:ubiquitin 1 [Schistosoma japonicum]|nr:ubiquitin 1 [Schistosoma japonicum]
MLIFVRGLSGTVIPLNVNSHESVLSVKIRIFYLKSIPVHDQHLLYTGSELTDQTILSTVNIGHGALLLLVIGLKTGPLGRYDLSLGINPKYANHENLSSQSIIYDEIEYTQLLSLLSSSTSPSSSSSSSTVIFPSICVTPVCNATKMTPSKLEQTETNLLLMNSTESYNNDCDVNDNVNNANCITSTDDEINQIAELLGYANDDNEHLSSFLLYDDFTNIITNENEEYNYSSDETDQDYHYEHSFNPSQQTRWLKAPNYNYAQHLNLLKPNSENVNFNNSSHHIHKLNSIEMLSERCQSTNALFNKPTIVFNSSLLNHSHLSLPNVNIHVDMNNNSISELKNSLYTNDTTVDKISNDLKFYLPYSNSIPLLNITNVSISSIRNSSLELLHNSNNHTSMMLSSSTCLPYYLTKQINDHSSTYNKHLSNSLISYDTTIKTEIISHTNNQFKSQLNQTFSPKVSENHSNENININKGLLNPTGQHSEQIQFDTNCDNDDLKISSSSVDMLQPSSSFHSSSSSSSSCTSYSSSINSSSCSTTTHLNQSRCYECNRRTRLACGFTCRCERWFCTKHHHPEDHQCNFNFKTILNSI